jgi:uncharacterized protein (TIGR00290 family)
VPRRKTGEGKHYEEAFSEVAIVVGKASDRPVGLLMADHGKPRVLLSWSTGKDSAWTLHVLRLAGEVEVVGLLTTVNQAFDRVAMHAVRREVLEAQAEAVGLPLVIAPIPWPCPNVAYEAAFGTALDQARADLGITHIAFGDLFLEDVRVYRERQLEKTGLTPLFPLWGLPTRQLAHEMVDSGLRAILTCVDPRHLPASFAGRTFDAQLLADLPADVDPCGESGEFHTLAYAGPMFSSSLAPTCGEIVEREGFIFADVACAELQSASEEQQEESIFDADGALTRQFLLNRGYCCGNRCRNCPYEWEAVPEGMP